jgi:cupin 2 domain-containing protein
LSRDSGLKRRRAGPGKAAVKTGSLWSELSSRHLTDEAVDMLLERPGVRIERIVSTGQVTPDGQWYDQVADEWVLVVAGAARLRIEGEDEDRELGEGDWIVLPAHCRHRVTWTREEPPTVWLAIHVAAAEAAAPRGG